MKERSQEWLQDLGVKYPEEEVAIYWAVAVWEYGKFWEAVKRLIWFCYVWDF